MEKKTHREYLTAISIMGGIITLIEPDGSIGYYRQRGMASLNAIELTKLARVGLVHRNWKNFKELPKHYSISFEDTELCGKAFATFAIR